MGGLGSNAEVTLLAVSDASALFRSRPCNLRHRIGGRLNGSLRRNDNAQGQEALSSFCAALRWLTYDNALQLLSLGQKCPCLLYLPDPLVAGVGVLRGTVGVSCEFKKKFRSLN